MIEGLITRYGALALFLGAGLEGETVALVGGMVAHRGLVPLPLAWGAVFASTLLADQLLFLAGRRGREQRLVVRLLARPAVARARGLLERRPMAFVFLFRFLYGLRTASPVLIGASGFSPARFRLLNLGAALAWSALFVGLGYALGAGIERLLGRIERVEQWLVLLLVPAAIIGLAKLVASRRRRNRAA